MKTRLQIQQHGSTFITAVVAAGVLSILVVSFLTYLSNEHYLNFRSHAWNRSLHLAEAALEVGFSELNYQYFLGGSGFTIARGWTNTASGNYSKSVTNFVDNSGNVVGYFSVTVSGVGNINPIVQGVSTCPTAPRGPTVSRAIKAQCMATSLFPVGMMSKSFMDMNGNNVYVDSYDSTDVSKSTSGLYDLSKRQSNGNIATDGTVLNSLSIGNADIYGVAYTGPGGSVALGSSGSVGPTFVTADRATTAAAGSANGWIQSDFNVDVSTVTLPGGATSWPVAPGATGSGIGSISKDATLTNGDFRVGNVTLNSSAHGDVLTIAGNVRLYVTGDFNVAGLGGVVIQPGASLTIYIGGNVTISGNGVVNNTAQPIKDQWFGLSTSTSWSVSGNGQFVGTIYAPNANMTMNGGGSSGDVSGGIVANTITLNGQVKFHYDESLRSANTGTGYSFVSWQELRNVSGTWVP